MFFKGRLFKIKERETLSFEANSVFPFAHFSVGKPKSEFQKMDSIDVYLFPT